MVRVFSKNEFTERFVSEKALASIQTNFEIEELNAGLDSEFID